MCQQSVEWLTVRMELLQVNTGVNIIEIIESAWDAIKSAEK